MISLFRSLHSIAAQRGDGLLPELLKMSGRSGTAHQILNDHAHVWESRIRWMFRLRPGQISNPVRIEMSKLRQRLQASADLRSDRHFNVSGGGDA